MPDGKSAEKNMFYQIIKDWKGRLLAKISLSDPIYLDLRQCSVEKILLFLISENKTDRMVSINLIDAHF